MSDLFYVRPERVIGDRIVFPRDESAHIRKVCRRGRGDVVRVTDGVGRLLTVEITGTGETLRGRVRERRRVTEPGPEIDLAVGIGKRDRMSWLVEKATELGLTRFHPLITEWSSAQRYRDEWEAPLRRWRRVAVAGIKQSGRCLLPEIHRPRSLERYLGDIRPEKDDRTILLERGAGGRPLDELLDGAARRYCILVGPEGGWSADEVSRITTAGFRTGYLIDRPLRFETAGIAALSLIATLTRPRST